MRRDEIPIVKEYCKDKVIEELEKMKAEIATYCDYHGIYDWGILDLIGERIKEIKGE